MRVLITGCSGFVGSHFVRRLVAEGNEVTGVDIGYSTCSLPLDHEHCYIEDVRQFMGYRLCDDFDLIIHCAAIVGGRENMEDNPLGVAANLSIDVEFFNWIAKGKIKKRVVYFSSSAIYPPELQERHRHCALAEGLVDLSASRFALPETTYGFAKFAGEYLARQTLQKCDAEIVIYRPFGGYGEDQDLTYPFPAIIQRVARMQNPVVVWGSGEQERDFIHIDDVVAMVLASYAKTPSGTVLNLGTGNGISFRRLAELICVVAGHRADVINDPTKPEGVFSRIADIYLMEQFGLKIKVPLVQGIKRSLAAAGLTLPKS